MGNCDAPRLKSRRYEKRRLKLIASLASGSVLDLGYAALPNRYLDGPSTVGVDLIAPAAETSYAEEHIGSVMALEAVVGGRKFDTIIAGELIEHLRDPYRFLAGLRVLMEDTSRLVLSTPNPIGMPVVLFEYLRSTRYFYTEDHTYYFTPRWVRRMLEVSGFHLDSAHAVGIWLPLGPAIPCPVSMSYQVVYRARLA